MVIFKYGISFSTNPLIIEFNALCLWWPVTGIRQAADPSCINKDNETVIKQAGNISSPLSFLWFNYQLNASHLPAVNSYDGIIYV